MRLTQDYMIEICGGDGLICDRYFRTYPAYYSLRANALIKLLFKAHAEATRALVWKAEKRDGLYVIVDDKDLMQVDREEHK
jgi:hypothetical protein